MKKLCLSAAILALVLCTNASKAQMMISPGVKGGLSLTGLTNLKGDQRVTGHGGLFVHYSINKNWCIQPEVLFSAQGQKFINQTNNENTLVLDYLQLPMMLQYYPAKQFYVEAGPQVGFLLNAKNKGFNGDKADVAGNYRKADVGLNFGVGVNATKNIGIYGRYNLGLIDVAKNEDVYRQNRGVQLGVAFRVH